MRPKTILLSLLMLLAVAGVVAAASGGHWWKKSSTSSDSGAPGSSQNLPAPPEEYRRLFQGMQVTDSAMDVSGSIRIYDGERDGLLKEVKPFRAFRRSRQWYYQLSYLQTFCDGDLVLVLDTLHHQMEVSKPDVAAPDAITANMPSAMLFNDSAQFKVNGRVEQDQAERILTLHSDYNPEIKVCRLYYDTASYRLHRTEIEWWKDRVGRDTASSNIWLAKLDYVYRPRTNEDIGREMRSYIILGAEGVKPADRYADYQVKVNF